MKFRSCFLSVALTTALFAVSMSDQSFAGLADSNENGVLDDAEMEKLLDDISDAEVYLLQSFWPSTFDEKAKEKIISHFGLQDMKVLDSQLRKIYDYVEYDYVETSDTEGVDLPDTLPVYSDSFSSEKEIGYPLFECVQEMCHNMDFAAQILNPEYSLDVGAQTLEHVHVYLSCFADADKEELQSIIESNTDQILSALQYSFPNIQIDIVSVNWKIPVIDEESLYSASYWCENKDGSIERGDGTGELYQ